MILVSSFDDLHLCISGCPLKYLHSHNATLEFTVHTSPEKLLGQFLKYLYPHVLLNVASHVGLDNGKVSDTVCAL